MTVGKNTPSAMVAIFEVSPMPSQRMSSGRSAIFGIGNSADTMGKPAARASENRPTASPTATPTAVPMIQPAPMRSSDIETCAHNSPDAASRQSARTIAKGLGRNRAFTRPSDPAACQAASTIANTSHEVAPRGARSEEHTSELQSRRDLVCRLLLEKKKKKDRIHIDIKKKKKMKKKKN